jgi:Tfp pilus assembly protein PilW
MGALTLVVTAVIISFFNTWKAYLFDGEFASITG